jgi:hypothetical protein
MWPFVWWASWWPWKRCVECGRRYRLMFPWSAFQEFCSQKCVNAHMDFVDSMSWEKWGAGKPSGDGEQKP